MAFWREPEPLASIGIEVISAEIVLGATAPAGAAPTPGEQQVNAATAATDPQQTDPQREAEQKATEQPQNVQVAPRGDRARADTTLERQADERRRTTTRRRRARSASRPSRSPRSRWWKRATPDTATAAPREIPPDATDVSLLPQPEEKPVEAEARAEAELSRPRRRSR